MFLTWGMRILLSVSNAPCNRQQIQLNAAGACMDLGLLMQAQSFAPILNHRSRKQAAWLIYSWRVGIAGKKDSIGGWL